MSLTCWFKTFILV